MNIDASFICADARYLPFADRAFDVVFSYSVIQHFSRQNARIALKEIGRVARKTSFIQMANKYGIRSLYHQARHLRRAEGLFDVRYWTPGDLLAEFTACIGPSELSVDGFFGLGMQPRDAHDFLLHHRVIVAASEALRAVSKIVHPLTHVADSIYVRSVRAAAAVPGCASS